MRKDMELTTNMSDSEPTEFDVAVDTIQHMQSAGQITEAQAAQVLSDLMRQELLEKDNVKKSKTSRTTQ